MLPTFEKKKSIKNGTPSYLDTFAYLHMISLIVHTQKIRIQNLTCPSYASQVGEF